MWGQRMISAFKSKVPRSGLSPSDPHTGEDKGRNESPPVVSHVSPQCHFTGPRALAVADVVGSGMLPPALRRVSSGISA